MKKIVVLLLALCLGIYLITVVKAKGCKMIPREVLFGNSEKKVNPQISPNGKYLTYIAPVNNVMNIWIKTIDKDDARPISNDTDRGIQGYWWSFDNKQLFYMQDVGGNKNWRLYGVSIEDRVVKEYTPYDSVQVSKLEYVKYFPTRMLIEMNKRDPKAHDVYELNTQTGELVMILENPGKVVEWVADSELFVRGKLESDEGGFKFFVRNSHDATWNEVASWGLDEVTPNNFHFSKDAKYLYLTDSRDSNTSRLIKIDLASGQITEVASDPEYDMEGSLLVNNDTQEILAINYTKNRKHWIFFNSDVEDSFGVLKEIDHGDISLLSRTADDTVWVVSFVKDNGPIAFWLFNRITGQKTFLFDHQPIYKKYQLSSMEPIEFHARDGLLIHGYLTYPACSSSKKNLPLIIDVHGGPWTRDVWGFNSEVQWLANRGYAVLQINYRGSKGFGKSFLNAGKKQWGKAMQDDLTDGVHWAIEQGIADPKSVAIYGASYGGYAALIGATLTPDLYRCAVDIVGPTNLNTMLKSFPPYWSAVMKIYYDRVGDPETEQEFLSSISPLFHIEKIKIPILIAHGANDPQVKQTESEQIVAAMKEKDIDYEYLLFPDEGHGFVKPQNRLKFYKTAEQFLAKHLGGRYEN